MTEQRGQESPPAPAASDTSDAAPPTLAPLLSALEAEFGDRLDEAGRARVREQLTAILKSAAQVAAHPLANADEPDFVFSVFPEE